MTTKVTWYLIFLFYFLFIVSCYEFLCQERQQDSLPIYLKGNTNTNLDSDTHSINPHFSIAMARDSLRQRDEAKKTQLAEMEELDEQVKQLMEKNEEDRVEI
jgi:cell shape-determining protein MreC